jgi:hypothetical protein
MELTWIAIAASLLMGSGALLVFIWAVRQQHFSSFEDVKYQVFWSDPEGPACDALISDTRHEEQKHGSSDQGG